jgi:hypothetical protein
MFYFFVFQVAGYPEEVVIMITIIFMKKPIIAPVLDLFGKLKHTKKIRPNS